ncbi:MAG: hypothetical protein HOV81_06370, partial [Kofleriaceae bacterium]|nr:hypothetical protein [Kofleriaceae bacterium]
MAFAGVSIAVMIYVLVGYMREDHRAPTAKSTTAAPAVPSASGDTHPAPFDAWHDGKLGDWYAYKYVTSSKLGAFHSTVLVTVTAATDASVATSFRGKVV